MKITGKITNPLPLLVAHSWKYWKFLNMADYEGVLQTLNIAVLLSPEKPNVKEIVNLANRLLYRHATELGYMRMRDTLWFKRDITMGFNPHREMKVKYAERDL